MKLNPNQVDREFCKGFEERVVNSPKKVFDKIISHPIFDHPMIQNAFKVPEEDNETDSAANTQDTGEAAAEGTQNNAAEIKQELWVIRAILFIVA